MACELAESAKVQHCSTARAVAQDRKTVEDIMSNLVVISVGDKDTEASALERVGVNYDVVGVCYDASIKRNSIVVRESIAVEHEVTDGSPRCRRV